MASAKRIISLLFFFVGFGIISSTTDPGDASVLLHLRRIWKNTPPNWAHSDDPCSLPWDGVTCNNSRIILLKLASMGIEGKLIPEIGQLTELHCLDLSFNSNLTGPIPSSIGNMRMLKMLCLCASNLGGTIPPEIVNLQMLNFLALNSNNLSGEIPANIGRLTKLDWLDLGNNNLRGPLPLSSGSTAGLDKLVNTRHFHFGQNQLSGTIPEALFHPNMTLIHVLFEGNSFTGPIPASVGLLRHLEILRLDRNALTGAVPPSIRNLTRLGELNLASNGLTGDVPDLTGMASLKCVDLSYNVFTSSLAPSWFFRLQSLSVVLMQYAGLMGEVPPALFSTPQLKEVILRNNKFNGTVDLGMAIAPELLVDLRSNIITSIKNEPRRNSSTLILFGNPVCNSQSASKSFCKLAADPQAYSTVNDCTTRETNQCPAGEFYRPRDCRCGHPYSGTLIFQSPSFRDLKNTTRFRMLEQDLRRDLSLEDDSVSIKDPRFDEDDYLRLRVELFPPGKDYFKRTRVLMLGFNLGSQKFSPQQEWGPYMFEAEPYIFDHGRQRLFSTAVVAGIASSSVVLFIGLVALAIYAVREKREVDRARRVANPFANWETDDSDAGKAPQLNGVSFFSIADLSRCTDDFSRKNEIGVGGYGQVYKGKLPSGQAVAIKRAKKGSIQGALEFKTEIELLSRVHHTNLVRLVGFCYEKGEQMLIYEYIPNGTLAESLSGKIGIQLSWIDRLRIALGSARGLAYLHDLADPPIIHRDVKTANILLDERLRPKVADFGLSSLAADAESASAAGIKGTLGYLDPEYFETQQLTDKSDVYSFGVVMLELVTGKKPIEKNKFIVHETRAGLQSPDGVKEIVDPVIRNTPVLAGLERFVGLAMRCVEHFSADRPTTREVVKEIESILEGDGLESRSTSMASSVRDFRVEAARRRYNESVSSLEMSSNAFDSSGAGFMLRTTIEPK